jgi:hypothetical protein
MTKVFVFISNMNPKLMSLISSNLMPVINKDEYTNKYRTSIQNEYMYINRLQDMQDMYISCAKESQENIDLKLCLQDFIINEKCQKENYFKKLHHLCQQNKGHTKSIMIRNEGICGLLEIINILSDLPHIEKLFYQGEIVKEKIMSLLLNPLKCLTVISNKWENNQFVRNSCQLPAEINGRLVQLQHLESLYIQGFTMTHELMETLFNFLTSKTSMKEISLNDLSCSNHDTSCRGFHLDLSQNSQLRYLGVEDIPVSQINMDVSLLEACHVGLLYKPGVVSSFLSQLPAASKLHTFSCSYLEFSTDIETMLQTLPLLHHLKNISMWKINLCERSLILALLETILPWLHQWLRHLIPTMLRYINVCETSLTLSPQMIHIKDVYLWDITVSCSVLHDLITVISKLPQTVTVFIVDCDIKPETEFEKLKAFIKQSEYFVVTYDGTFKSEDLFAFETKANQT